MKNLTKELINKLSAISPKKFKVAVMPHFCLDNFLQYDGDFKNFIKDLEKLNRQGGGNLRIKQTLSRGGKAANVASALSNLGIKTYLITRTSEYGHALLKNFFDGSKVDLSLVKKDGSLAITTAIELKKTNLMLSDPGSLIDFGPKNINTKDKIIIKNCDLAYISDWGLNDKGTDLVKEVFSLAKKNKTKTFFDPGDSSSKNNERKEIEKLKQEILDKNLADFLSVNEAEIKKLGGIKNLKTNTSVQLHTSKYSQSLNANKSSQKIPVFKVAPKRLTGAGDSWNAGNIFGELLGLNDNLKLLLSNAVAAYYISDKNGKHPSINELIKFLQK